MARVIIDGVEYVPTGSAVPRFGVAITSYNRNDLVKKHAELWRKHSPAGTPVLIIDDGSPTPVAGADVRLEPNQGIPAAKNASLAALMDLGVEHLFLVDDDCYPLVDEWWRPYVESPEPHLMATFLDLSGRRKLRDIAEVYRDDRHVAYTGPRGYFLYFHRSVVEAVGGFDVEAYGRGMYEHGDLSNRIFAAGWTSHRFGDVVGSEKLIKSLDQDEAVERTNWRQRAAADAGNARVYRDRMDSGYAGFVPFRPQRDVVITCLYSGKPDPQRRNSQLPPSLAPAKTLLASLGDRETVVLHDRITDTAPANVELVKCSLSWNVFFQRHLDAWRYLRANEDVRFAWLVDATDVEMLRDPFPLMERGKLYLGCEPTILSNEWMRKSHPAPEVQKFIDAHPHDQLLNAGLIGGDRETLMEFLHEMVRLHGDRQMRRFWREDAAGDDLGDMGHLQVAADKFRDRLVTGPFVCTTFRAEEKNGHSLWRHK